MKTNEKGDTTNNIDIKTIDTKKYNIKKALKGEGISSLDDITYKVILIGDPNVGKESIIQNLINENRPNNGEYKPTIGFDIFNYSAHVNEKIITMQIWDTCGLLDFCTCTPSLFKNTSLAIIVYDISNRVSFENLENWINLIELNCNNKPLFFVVGNKKGSERKVTTEEGKKFTEENKFDFFIEFSEEDKQYEKIIFDQALAQLYELYNNYQKNNNDDDDDYDKIEVKRLDFSKRKGTFKLNIKKNHHKNKVNKKVC